MTWTFNSWFGLIHPPYIFLYFLFDTFSYKILLLLLFWTGRGRIMIYRLQQLSLSDTSVTLFMIRPLDQMNLLGKFPANGYFFLIKNTSKR